ncbi:MAG: hypothetical protein WCQ87_01525 [Parabacteroides sp.]
MKFYKTAIFLLSSFCFSTFALDMPETENSWKISIGTSYRSFESPKFKGNAIPDAYYVYDADDSDELLKENTAENRKIVWDNLGKSGVIAYLPFVKYYGSGSSHGDYGFQESIAPVLNASYDLLQISENTSLSITSSFQYYQLDSKSACGYGMQGNIICFDTSDGIKVPPVTLTDDASYQDTYTLSKNISMDMDLYVFDFGASITHSFNNGFDVFASVGPSLTLADMESSSDGVRDNSSEFEFGYYGSIGASYWYNDNYGLSLEYRYDDSFGNVGTSLFEQDLSSSSTMLKFLIRF